MSIYRERQDELERYQIQMGTVRGRLALTMDLLTDALVLVGQHGVYCRSARHPEQPAMDIQLITKGIEDAKQLITDAMGELRGTGAPAGGQK
jgi:hypothetical protein